MSHPIVGHDYSEKHNEETRTEYARRKGEALGKVEQFPKEYVQAKRYLRRALKRVGKTAGMAKNLAIENKKK